MEYWKICRDSDKTNKIVQLGVGSFGEVYKCDNVAEKRFIDFYSNTQGLESSTIKEFSILEELNHQNIVRLLGSYDDIQRFYIYTPFAISDLASLIYRTKDSKGNKVGIPKNQIKNYMYQVSSGLEYLHQNYIAHGDVKPGNVLVYPKNELRLADFGMSRILNDPDAFLKAETSPFHQPPEMLLLEEPIRYAMDVWQLGIIFLELKLEKNIFAPDEYRDMDDLDYQMLENMLKIMGYPPDYIVNHTDENNLYLLDDYVNQESMWNDYGFSKHELALVESTLTWDPYDRFNIKELLNSTYFKSEIQNSTKIAPKSLLEKTDIIVPLYKESESDIRLNRLLEGLAMISNSQSYFLGVTLLDKLLNRRAVGYVSAYSTWCFYLASRIYNPYDSKVWTSMEKRGLITKNSPKELKTLLEALDYRLLPSNFSDLVYDAYQKKQISYDTLEVGIWILLAVYLDANLMKEYSTKITLGLSSILYLAASASDDALAEELEYSLNLITKTIVTIQKYGLRSSYQRNEHKRIKENQNIDLEIHYRNLTIKGLVRFIQDQVRIL